MSLAVAAFAVLLLASGIAGALSSPKNAKSASVTAAASASPPGATVAPTASGSPSPTPAATASVARPTSAGPTPKPVLTTNAAGDVEPDRALTPGQAFPGVTPAQVCQPGYSASVRDVPDSVRHAVFAAYGISYALHSQYELDHLVSLELGGDNAAANLWPEPLNGPGGAKVKDKLENKLHALVCSGQLGLSQAQQAIAGDWAAAYAKYEGTAVSYPTQAPAPSYAPPPVTQPPPVATQPPPAPPANVVHPGAFCAPEGATGVTDKGTPMVCGPASDGRNRWHSA